MERFNRLSRKTLRRASLLIERLGPTSRCTLPSLAKDAYETAVAEALQKHKLTFRAPVAMPNEMQR